MFCGARDWPLVKISKSQGSHSEVIVFKGSSTGSWKMPYEPSAQDLIRSPDHTGVWVLDIGQMSYSVSLSLHHMCFIRTGSVSVWFTSKDGF